LSRPDFMPTAQITPRPAQPAPPGQSPLPTLFREGYGTYNVRPGAFVLSYAANLVVVALLILSAQWVVAHRKELKEQVVGLVTDVTPYMSAGGGGGGGDHDKLTASKGAPPKFAKRQFTPPTVVVRNEAPKLAMDPTVVGPPQIHFDQAPTGDPMSKILGPPSNGPGSGGGIGSGSGGGVGSGHGLGVGPGYGSGFGGGVAAPKVIYQPEAEYSEEARKAKFQGAVTLSLIVGVDGLPRDIRVARSVGLGLDEKAIEAVRKWRFEPARKAGQPVAVHVNVEVTFNLY